MPTMISHSKKFIFFHVQKVAGVSISAYLNRYEEFNLLKRTYRRISIKRPRLRNCSFKLGPIEFFASHATVADVAGLIDPVIFQSYFKFAVVRNPWEIEVSRYNYQKSYPQHPNYNHVKNMSFEQYIEEKFNSSRGWNQVDRLSDHNGKLSIDRILRFERLDNDFFNLCEKLNLEIDAQLPKKNTSAHLKYRDYYTNRTRQWIAQYAARDIETFGYCF